MNSKQEPVQDGALVCELTFAGTEVIQPHDHVMFFIGDYPHDATGNKLDKIFNASESRELSPGLVIDHTFSAKPQTDNGKYRDYHHKVTTYAGRIEVHARSLNPALTSKTFRVVTMSEEEGPFKYPDTASSRADIDVVIAKLARGKVAIVGLGGTGSYVLDFVAKTPVDEIHVYDGDVFSQHNAFRGPGAPTAEELNKRPLKVAYWVEK